MLRGHALTAPPRRACPKLPSFPHAGHGHAGSRVSTTKYSACIQTSLAPTNLLLGCAMADPFEVRMRFSSQLQHLNASTASSQKAAQYALKYKDMDEDLHSCILEQLEKVSLGLSSPDTPLQYGTSET
ncbi:CTD kinase subunit gamma CTK3-domain-containing protein [Xylariaceae sp. FL0804]|nr:CTD kinase subunit gamma CTK3-domain-containing protein [Xylariaceae sp. FL0804]